jgi:uncharacterized protein
VNPISDLVTLVREMHPVLCDTEFVFCTLGRGTLADCGLDVSEVLGLYHEEEGVSVILERCVAARAGLRSYGTFRRITLQVHSSLEAVGLTAAVASGLAAEGISANVVAAYHHDHVFVPADDAGRAIGVLRRLSDGG